ncbi:YfgM family protein [Methylophaga sp. OBS1]|uniref:YfgM family protein n=1 Tax=Methylophaga sp. OBS1 TaxID=2991933 RepID=UPI002255B87E|nr:tetratricopeptide repeat protein [Methylophaga sp. OBS1]MCX4193346.1 tetratricopeptide repeat protein [Methylophaga sp. OBS1]
MDIYASDEEKAEAIKQWWRENGRSVIAGIILGLAGIFGFRYWMNYQQVQTQQAAVIYQQTAVQLSQAESADAERTVETLMQDYPSSVYAVFAALEMAESKLNDGQADAAVNYLSWVRDEAKLQSHRELARLRLARVLFSQDKLDEALSLIAEADSQAFSSLFAELKGDINLAQGDTIAAKAAYQQALAQLTPGEPRQSLLEIKLDDVAKADEA